MRAIPNRSEPNNTTARNGTWSSVADRADAPPFTTGNSPPARLLVRAPRQIHSVQLGIDVRLETTQPVRYATRQTIVAQGQSLEVAEIAQLGRNASGKLVALQGQHLEAFESA